MGVPIIMQTLLEVLSAWDARVPISAGSQPLRAQNNGGKTYSKNKVYDNTTPSPPVLRAAQTIHFFAFSQDALTLIRRCGFRHRVKSERAADADLLYCLIHCKHENPFRFQHLRPTDIIVGRYCWSGGLVVVFQTSKVGLSWREILLEGFLKASS